MNLGAQLGPMSITKLSPNWAYQIGPIHFINFLLSGWALPDLFGSSSLYNLPIILLYVYSSLFSRSLGHPPSLDLHSSLLSSLLPLLSLYFSVCSLLVFFLVQRVPLPPIFALRTLKSHALRPPLLHQVARATTVASLLYA